VTIRLWKAASSVEEGEDNAWLALRNPLNRRIWGHVPLCGRGKWATTSPMLISSGCRRTKRLCLGVQETSWITQ